MSMYGTVYGMQKTTVYLPDDLKRALERIAATRGCSEAELMREAVRTLAGEAVPPRPRLPLFKSGKRGLAERVDQALAGFGAR
jgi:plasmid stability protein